MVQKDGAHKTFTHIASLGIACHAKHRRQEAPIRMDGAGQPAVDHGAADQSFSSSSSGLAEASLPGSTGSSRLAINAANDMCVSGIVIGGVCPFAVSVWVPLFFL